MTPFKKRKKKEKKGKKGKKRALLFFLRLISSFCEDAS